VWALVWVAAAAYVYTSLKQLEDYGETTVTAATGLEQTSNGLVRVGRGLREAGAALDQIPFVGEQLDASIRRTAADVDRIALTVRRTSREARATGIDTRDAAQGVALVLGAAVALVPTLPLLLVYVLLRPVLAERLVVR
jgi:hypothetical protein